MTFREVLRLMESPQADLSTLKEYKKWCDENNEYVGSEKSIKEFSKTFYKNAEDISKYLKSVITVK